MFIVVTLVHSLMICVKLGFEITGPDPQFKGFLETVKRNLGPKIRGSLVEASYSKDYSILGCILGYSHDGNLA